MGYFDSAKNRALWEKELNDLEEQREQRKTEGYNPRRTLASRTQTSGEISNPKVRRINLKELEEIERQARLAQGDDLSTGGRVRRRSGRTAEGPDMIPEEKTLREPVLQELRLTGPKG